MENTTKFKQGKSFQCNSEPGFLSCENYIYIYIYIRSYPYERGTLLAAFPPPFHHLRNWIFPLENPITTT